MAKSSGELTIKTIQELIRYDIPTLLVGVSSIGKSFTITSIARRFRINHRMLFIGSEKPENIEGLPKLHDAGERLEYFKPNWFPNEQQITSIVTNGRKLFRKYIAEYYIGGENFQPTYTNLNAILEAFALVEWGQTETIKEVKLVDMTTSQIGKIKVLNDTEFKVEREILTKDQIVKGESGRDDVRDICSYVCTVLGYGNFWLILDEIDKVEEFDIDKYAPMLHIVRERTLKNWNLIEINDGKGIDIPKLVKMSNYQTVIDIIDNAIDNKQSFLDTRVIAIANKTNNIEDALSKRFVQILIRDVLILEKSKITSEQASLQSCLTSEGVMGQELDEPPMKRLDSLNLQWAYNFLIKMTNKNDLQGNFLYTDAIELISQNKEPQHSPEHKAETKKLMRKSALYQLLIDNFDSDANIIEPTLECLTSLMFTSVDAPKSTLTKEQEQVANARAYITTLMEEFDNDESLVKDQIILTLSDTYPKSIKETGADKDAAKTIKIAQVENWIGSAYAYLDATIYNDLGKFAPVNLNKSLIPSIQHLIDEKLVLDSEVPIDSKSVILLDAGKWWGKRKDDILKLKVNGEEVKRVLYTANYPVFGVDYSIKNQSTAINKNSLFVIYSIRNMAGLLQYLQSDKNTIQSIAADELFYEYMKDVLKPYIINQVIPSWEKLGGKYVPKVDKLKQLFV